MPSRYPEIQALLDRVDQDLSRIKTEYERALTSQKIPSALQIDIKNYFQNLRSALDYVSKRIPGFGKNFPMCDHVNAVANATATAGASAAVLARWQPHLNDWLRWFNWLNNEHKHATLVPQKKQERVETTVAHPSGSSVTWGQGVTFSGGVSMLGVPIDPRSQLPIPNSILTTTRTVWVDFTFDSSGAPAGFPQNLSVFPFLTKCRDEIKTIVADVEASIP